MTGAESAHTATPRSGANGDGRLTSDELNRIVLDSLPAHVAVLGADGTILSTNAAWRRFQEENGGTPGSGGVGGNYLTTCRQSDGEGADVARKVADGIESVLRGDAESFTLEYPSHAPTEQRWFLLSVTPLTAAPGHGVVVTHINITDRKLSEEATRARAAELAHMARSLKRTNEELDHFAYITSHDLRAPLRGIANLSRWIEEDMGERFTPEAHQQMEMLRGRVNRMEAMIDGILEYSRVGRVKVATERIDVGTLLAEVIDLLDPPERIRIDIQAGMPVVMGHKLRLQQVFMNLLGNAIKHHDKPAGRIVVSWRAVGTMFEFAVADDGPGIEAQYHEKVFVIFQTLQPRDKVEGTGVGLSLVKKIVEGEGGSIAVESEPGQGATFRFTWPHALEAESGGSPAAGAAGR
jgi:signal transduction histidine kinase